MSYEVAHLGRMDSDAETALSLVFQPFDDVVPIRPAVGADPLEPLQGGIQGSDGAVDVIWTYLEALRLPLEFLLSLEEVAYSHALTEAHHHLRTGLLTGQRPQHLR